MKTTIKINSVGELCDFISANSMCSEGCAVCGIPELQGKYDIEATITKKCDCTKNVSYTYESEYETFLKECKDCSKSWEIDADDLTEDQIKLLFETEGDNI